MIHKSERSESFGNTLGVGQYLCNVEQEELLLFSWPVSKVKNHIIITSDKLFVTAFVDVERLEIPADAAILFA